MVKLSELKIGDIAIIRDFSNEEIYIKLMEMGCLPGETIKVLNKAAMGDPISISVVGYTLSLRLDEAAEIIVEMVSPVVNNSR